MANNTLALPAPLAFAIGSDRWPGLSKLSEESGEVMQVIGKLLGTGGEVHHWDGSKLDERLALELGDLLAAIDFVVANNPQLPATVIAAQREAKFSLFTKWHVDQRDAGGR